MYETGLVRRACPPVGDDVLPGHRFAGGAMPLLPFLGAVGFAVGVQEQVVADRAAAVLAAEQAQGAGFERGCACGAGWPSTRFGWGRRGTPHRGGVGAGRWWSRRLWVGRRRCRGRRTPSGPAWPCCAGRSTG